MPTKYSLTRRGLLGGIGAISFGASTASATSPSNEFGPGELLDHETLAAETIQQLGDFLLQIEQGTKEFAIEASKPIAAVYREIKDTTGDVLAGATDIFDLENIKADLDVTIKWVRPIYKFMDVIEGVADVSLPTLPLYRALLFGAKLSSIGGVLLALKALGEAAVSIVTTVAESTKSAVTEDQYEDFYLSMFLSVAEIVLFVFPISFSFAWRGTRWATNHLLFRLRRLPFGNQILALVMSFFHWVIRDIPREAIYNLEEISKLLDYLTTELEVRAKELEGVKPPSVNEVRKIVQEMYKDYLDKEVQVTDIRITS